MHMHLLRVQGKAHCDNSMPFFKHIPGAPLVQSPHHPLPAQSRIAALCLPSRLPHCPAAWAALPEQAAAGQAPRARAGAQGAAPAQTQPVCLQRELTFQPLRRPPRRTPVSCHQSHRCAPRKDIMTTALREIQPASIGRSSDCDSETADQTQGIHCTDLPPIQT